MEVILTIAIPIGVFLVALAGLVYRIYATGKRRRWENIQEARKDALPKLKRFYTIMFDIEYKSHGTPEHLKEIADLYADVRDSYKRFRRGFRKRDRKELDELLGVIENNYDRDDLETSVISAMPHIPEFMVEIRTKLDRDF